MSSSLLPKAPFANCQACPLKDRPFVASDPFKPNAKLMIVGESPGGEEVKAAGLGEPEAGFVGFSGALLWKILAKHKLSRSDCNVTNAVLCQPPGNPADKEKVMGAAAACCLPRLRLELRKSETPVLALGKIARQSVFGNEDSEETRHGRWQQVHIDSSGTSFGRMALSADHPAFVGREPSEARTMIEDIGKFCRSVKEHVGPLDLPNPPEYEVITKFNDLVDILRVMLIDGSWIAFDIETDQIDAVYDDILMLGLYNGKGKAYIVPGWHPGAPVNLLKSSATEWLMLDFWSNAKTIAHNGKFDTRFLNGQLKWRAQVGFDTMLAHFAIDERPGTHSLKRLAARYLDVPDYEGDIKKYLRSANDKYSKIPWKNLCQYLAWDVWCTWHLKPVLEKKLKAVDGYGTLFNQILMPLNTLAASAEQKGIMIDQQGLDGAFQAFGAEIRRLDGEIIGMSQGTVKNVQSTVQVAKLLYDVLKLPTPKGRKMKPRATSKDALAQHKGKHPVIALLSKRRRIAKMQSSYIENLSGFADGYGRIHPDWFIHGTEVGRLSVRNPALQTIPRADDREDGQYGTIIKNLFVASTPERALVVCDYSQAEMRVAAALSGEKYLIKAYEDERDVHSEVAIGMYGPNYSKEQRVLCKMFNFSYLYGGNEWSFAQDAGLPIEMAREFVQRYDRLMPDLAKWKVEKFAEMRSKGYVESRTGRRRRIPLITRANYDDARKSSFHAVTAGSASDMTCLSAIYISQAPRWTTPVDVLLLVHDSVIAECNVDQVVPTARGMKAIMEATAKNWFPEVKWLAEVESGYRWGSTKPVEI